jgi:hypothetical protein
MDNQQNISMGGGAEERALRSKAIKQMTTNLTTTNFKLGDQRPEYRSTAQEAMLASSQIPTERVGLNEQMKVRHDEYNML